MRKITILSLISCSLLLGTACEEEGFIDCLAEGDLITVDATEDSQDPKVFRFELTYDGAENLDEVRWFFGDGQNRTTETLVVEHTYVEAGTYEASVVPVLRDGNALCAPVFGLEVEVQ